MAGTKEAPFVALNMGSIPASLAERELFGNERGAYTDAKESRPGAIELANGGTLFLDEIGEAPLELQVKLLKVIEDGKFKRLGGQNEKKSSFKLICATNRDLYEMVDQKLFREDLLMRIATFVEKLPSLSERPEDIESLIRNMLPKICAENKVWIAYEDLPAEFIQYVQAHPIPGNIRGLDHLLARLLVNSPKTNSGRPDFSNWRRLLFPRARQVTRVPKSEIRIEFDPSLSSYSGLRSLISEFENRVMLRLSEQMMRTEDIAKALHISKASAHRILKRIGHSDRRKVAEEIHQRANSQRKLFYDSTQ